MGFYNMILLIIITLSFSFLGSHQLQSSQTQVLLQLKKQLEYPKHLEIWQEHGVDFCTLSPTEHVSVTCQDNVVTELRIAGEKPSKALSNGFTIDSFFTTLARLNTLRALSLVSLGIWGEIPDKIHRLESLENLDLSSNYLFGSIPSKISEMAKLQSLVMDGNSLNGSVPSWFDSLVDLRVLSLSNNRLTGPFPSSVNNVKTLVNLTISNNEISGKLPDLSLLNSLYILDLSGNKFDLTLPSIPKGLTVILLSKNAFSGKIPQEYGELHALQHLDLSLNTLTGSPPSSLFSLPNISYLNLKSNTLTGQLSDHIKCGENLEFVDISDNKLTGELPSCLSAKSANRVAKFDGNCLSTDIRSQHEESLCNIVNSDRKKSARKDTAVLVGVIMGIIVLSALLLLGLFALCRSFCSRGMSEQHLLQKAVQDKPVPGLASELSMSANNFISQAANLSKHGLTPTCRSFSLEELIDATKNFDASTYLGESSYGKIYKGRLENGTQVAIRCLPLSKSFSVRNVKLRLDLLSKLQHQHLVCLLGHCLDGGGRGDYNPNKVYLVYEFMPNGTFRDHLSEKSSVKVFTWFDRLAVLIGVAKAVHFLHTGIIPGFLNNRLRSNNILLDQHRMAKLSDYGLSIISAGNEAVEGRGEGDRSWKMASIEDDAYSFGFVILEALVGPSLAATREAFLLKEMATLQCLDGRARLIEPEVLATSSSQESVSIVISLMHKCISPDASRPSFEDILWNLQYASQVHATADRENQSDTASYL